MCRPPRIFPERFLTVHRACISSVWLSFSGSCSSDRVFSEMSLQSACSGTSYERACIDSSWCYQPIPRVSFRLLDSQDVTYRASVTDRSFFWIESASELICICAAHCYMKSEESMRSLCTRDACSSSNRDSPSWIGAATLIPVSGPTSPCSSLIKA